LSKKNKIQAEPFTLLLLTMVLTTLLILPQGMLLPSSASESIICEIQTTNLANQTVAGVLVEVYNATSGLYLNLSNETDGTGRVKFSLEVGNYTFKAFWKNVEVGAVTQNVTEIVPLQLNCTRLSNLKLTVTNETGAPIPFINLNLKYNYTTRDNETIPETGSFTSNINGTVILQNTFTNISYLIEARRYGFLFNTTFIESLPAQAWNNITIIAPTYALFVQVLDSKDTPAVGLNVKAYEWSSGINGEPLQQEQTNFNGNVTFSLTTGKYRLRVYNDTTFVNEVTVDLVQNPSFKVIPIDVYKVNLTVLVVDYFGQPIPNVLVVFQRKADSNYKIVENKTTASDGVAWFNGIIGGDSRIYVSMAGKPSETQYLYLVDSKQILFKLDGYVAVAGYALETSQFVTIVILLILIIAFIIASTYKRLPRLLQRRRK